MLFSIQKKIGFLYGFLHLILSPILSDAQQLTGKVTGNVVDENQLALPFVQVSLKLQTDSTSVKKIITDNNGHFTIEGAVGSYFIECKMMGYAIVYSKAFAIVADKTATLGTIQINQTAKQLATVNISAEAPFIERRADKLIVNLNGMGAGSPIMEVMNQLPGVIVTPDERISLNGKAVQIYIDGKETRLSAEALAGLLKSTPSSSIQKVELIVQPSAKYDAAGNAAIINIIRKRNYKSGLNGNLYGTVGKGQFGKANGGINLNYKGKFYNVLFKMGYDYNKYFYNSFIASSFVDGTGTIIGQSTSDIQSTRINTDYMPSLGTDFYLSKRTTLSASITPSFEFFDRNSMANNTNADHAGDITERSQFINRVNTKGTNYSYGLRLQHQIDTLGQEFTMDLDYYRYGNFNDQDNRTIHLDLNLNPISNQPSIIAQDRIFKVYAVKMDYTYPLGRGRQLEMGLKTSYVNADNSNIYRDINSEQTDLFFYKESISALYLTYGRTGTKFSYQLGIRGEYTFGEGEQETVASRFKRNYFQPFPSVHLNYKLAKKHNLNLGLNKKIERPDYESLNPLIRIISNSILEQGNPTLRPSIIYNADMWYSYNNSIFFGLTYSYNLDDFTSISIPLMNNVITTLPGNADYSGYTTLQGIYNKQVMPWWFTSTNAILFKRSFKGEIDGALIQRDGVTGLTAASYNSFSLSKHFSLMFRVSYKSKRVERTFTYQPFTYFTAGARQQFLNKRASAQLSFIDIFKSYKNVYQQNSGSIQQLWRNQFETRMLKVDFSYSFGGTIKNTKNSAGAEDEKKRSNLREN